MSILRVAVVFACALLLACPGKPPKGGGDKVVTKQGSGTKTVAPDAGVGKAGDDGNDNGGPAVAVAGIACVQPTCLYHAGADAYHACLTAGAGTCFHYGPTCKPKGACMFDKKSSRYRTCANVIEGACKRFGAGCEPEGKCYFNPADLRHHACNSAADGTCSSYGALCEPQ